MAYNMTDPRDQIPGFGPSGRVPGLQNSYFANETPFPSDRFLATGPASGAEFGSMGPPSFAAGASGGAAMAAPTQAATSGASQIMTGQGAMSAADTLNGATGMGGAASSGMMGMWGGAFPYVIGASMLMDMVKGFGKKGGGGGSMTMPLMTLGLLSGGMFGK